MQKLTFKSIQKFSRIHGPNSFTVIFLVALAVRLINLAVSDFSPNAMLLEDAAMYWKAVVKNQTFLDNALPEIFLQTERMPGYLLFLAAIVGIFGENFLPILVIQSVIDSVTCVLIAALGRYVYAKHYGILAGLPRYGPTCLSTAVRFWGTVYLFFSLSGSCCHLPVCSTNRHYWQQW